MALLATYPLMTISTMQATRGKAPAAAPAAGSPAGSPQPRQGALADIAEVQAPLRSCQGCGPHPDISFPFTGPSSAGVRCAGCTDDLRRQGHLTPL